jgi:hypothetical protein
MIAQYVRRGGNLKPEAKVGSLSYPGRQSSFKFTAGLELAGRVRVAGTLEINNHQKRGAKPK